MHVHDVTVVAGPGPGGYVATGTITIVDEYGQPVEDAHVTSHWEGCVSDGESGDTDANGQVSHTSPKSKDGGTFTLCVDTVTKTGWTYDSNANVETCDSDTAP
jgi:hypothetical protein